MFLLDTTSTLEFGNDVNIVTPAERFLPNRSETVRLKKPTDASITVTLHFLNWRTDNGIKPAIAKQIYTWVDNRDLYITPFSGFYRITITETTATNEGKTIQYAEAQPTAESNDSWVEVDFARITATTADATAVGSQPIDFFGPDFVQYGQPFTDSFKLFRNSSGLYKSSVDWPEEEMQFFNKLITDSDLIAPAYYIRICRFRGQDYPLCYVLPSHPNATDGDSDSNKGNDPYRPRKTILVGERCFYVLESGFLFLKRDLKEVGTTTRPSFDKDCMFASSIPGVRAVISNFEFATSDLSSLFDPVVGNDSTVKTEFPQVVNPNLVMYEPFYERINGSVTDRSPLIAPYSSADAGTARGRMWTTSLQSTLRTFDKKTTSAPGDTYANEPNVKPSIGFIQGTTANITLTGGSAQDPATIYAFKDVELWGGNSVLKVATTNPVPIQFLMVDGAVRFGSTVIGSSGVDASLASVEGNVFAYFVRCELEWSCSDGIDGNSLGVYTPFILEDRCLGAFMGENPLFVAAKNQCSTYHDGTKGIRVSCAYGRTYGQPVGDVGEGSALSAAGYSIDLGCFYCLARFNNDPNNTLSYAKLLGDNSYPSDLSIGWMLEPKFTDRYGRLSMPSNRRARIAGSTSLVVDRVYTQSTTSTNLEIYRRDESATVQRRTQ